MRTRKIPKLKEGLRTAPDFGCLKYNTIHTEVERGVLGRKNLGGNYSREVKRIIAAIFEQCMKADINFVLFFVSLLFCHFS
jgi:hypothetical protein